MCMQTEPPNGAMLPFATAIGVCGLRWGGQGISAVLMPGSPRLAKGPAASAGAAPPEVRRAAVAITALLEGERTDLRWIVLDQSNVDEFSRRVYEAAREVAPGETASYGQLAAAAGRPRAAREVGAALARNPFPIVVPCHRILSATGALHGFSAPGGVATKRRMLEIENAPGFTQRPLFA